MSYPMYGGVQPQSMMPNMGMAGQPMSYQNDSGNIWVQGEAGAKSYLVGPGRSVTLWDSEAQTIYIKSADQMGMPSMKILDYTIRGQEVPKTAALINTPANENYVLKSDFDALKDELSELREQIKRAPRQEFKSKNRGGGKL